MAARGSISSIAVKFSIRAPRPEIWKPPRAPFSGQEADAASPGPSSAVRLNIYAEFHGRAAVIFVPLESTVVVTAIIAAIPSSCITSIRAVPTPKFSASQTEFKKGKLILGRRNRPVIRALSQIPEPPPVIQTQMIVGSTPGAAAVRIAVAIPAVTSISP